MVDEIDFSNSDSHWVFHTPNGMRFSRTKNNYVNKELNLARMRLYFNSFSEMLIPTSLWESTQDEKLEIFSAMDAEEIRDIMVSGFQENEQADSINHHNIIEPFYLNTAINLNQMYAPAYKKEPFKYNVTVLMSKMIVTATPDMVRDMMQGACYAEMYSYYKDLKKYRPTMRI